MISVSLNPVHELLYSIWESLAGCLVGVTVSTENNMLYKPLSSFNPKY